MKIVSKIAGGLMLFAIIVALLSVMGVGAQCWDPGGSFTCTAQEAAEVTVTIALYITIVIGITLGAVGWILLAIRLLTR
jgi:hypothetical protein